VTDADIQMALNQGMNPEFARTFPIRQYGIFENEIVGIYRTSPEGRFLNANPHRCLCH
jgi:hypothetical protein